MTSKDYSFYAVDYFAWVELFKVGKGCDYNDLFFRARPAAIIDPSFEFIVPTAEKRRDSPLAVSIVPSFMLPLIIDKYGGQTLWQGKFPVYRLKYLNNAKFQGIQKAAAFFRPMISSDANEETLLGRILIQLYKKHREKWNDILYAFCNNTFAAEKIVNCYNVNTTQGSTELLNALKKIGLKKIPPALAKSIIAIHF